MSSLRRWGFPANPLPALLGGIQQFRHPALRIPNHERRESPLALLVRLPLPQGYAGDALAGIDITHWHSLLVLGFSPNVGLVLGKMRGGDIINVEAREFRGTPP